MNRQDRIQTGNWDIFRFLTATQVRYPDSEEYLTQTLHTFNYEDTLINLARINLFLQHGEAPEREKVLRRNFCSSFLRDEINRRRLTEHFIFNRWSTLRLLDKSASLSEGRSGPAPDATVDTMNDLTRCYLIANELLELEQQHPDFGPDVTDEKRKKLLAALIPDLEYAIKSSPENHIKYSLVRSYEFLTRLQIAASTFDVNETFSKATELTLQDYQFLILSILVASLSFSRAEILEGTGLCVDTKPSPILEPLYNKLLQHTCISIEELAFKVEKESFLPNEFLLWRKYPLVKIGENQVMCVDIGFLLEKLETGVFWIIRDQLEAEETGKGKEIIDLRGQIFEDYAASIIKRALPDTETCTERYIISPKYKQKQRAECTDIAVCSCDTLILFECKAPLLSAKTKLSGNFCKFYDGIKPNAIKGVEQLWNAIQTLGHTNKRNRRKVDGIDISKVKKIYPVLILPDRVFSFLFMNEFLNSEFQRFVKHKYLKKHLEIMPLTVLTIEDLEDLEPYLKDTPFHAHLDKWIMQEFLPNKFFSFSYYLRSLEEREMRHNTYMEQKARQMLADVGEYFSARGVD